MRPNGKHLDKYRKVHPKMGPSERGSLYGYFRLPSERAVLNVISSGEKHGAGIAAWEHVSVSIYQKAKWLPSWEEMCLVKDLFWRPDETICQFHPAESEYVNAYQVLHLWKPPYELALPATITMAPYVTGR